MASTKLNRTAGSTGNVQIWTWSGWVKRAAVPGTADAKGGLFATYTDGNQRLDFGIDANHRFFFKEKQSSSTNIDFTSNRLFEDPSAFYHFVLAVDTTDSTAADRVKVYLNGERITSWLDSTPPNQNYNTLMNVSGRTYYIGTTDGSSNYWNGIMSHVHFCDGTALAPTVFGSTDSVTGEWSINTSPSFTPGTNGFTILKDGNTITDQSSNSNDFSLGGGTLTNTEDNPSNIFATLNPLIANTGANFLNGNNNCHRTTSGNYRRIGCTLGATSGKYYAEFLLGASQWAGVCLTNGGDLARTEAGNAGYMGEYSADKSVGIRNDGIVYSHGANVSSAQWNQGSLSTSDRLCLALDLDNKKLFLGKNGTWNVSSNPATNTGGISLGGDSYTFCVATSNADCIINTGNGNFANGTTANLIASAGTNASGNGIFEYDVPTGFTALSTKGLNL